MGIEALYADGIEAGIQRQIRNPGPPPDTSFSLWSAMGAGIKGLPTAGLEVAGSGADLLAGIGQASDDMRARQGVQGLATRPEEAANRKAANAAFLAAGPALRRRADEFAPDPVTSHRADQVIHGLTRFAGKAVGAVGTMGPIGALPLGLEEGNTVAQRLMTEGVDPATAWKVGAVQGTLSAAGAVAPIAAATKMGTAALVAAGGPGAFMAQEALSKKILEKAGYADQASMHDPLDPLGLALSTLLPGAFGALHMRGAAKRATAVSEGSVQLQQMTPTERTGLKYNDSRLDAYAAQAAEANGVPPSILLGIKNAGEKSNSTQTSPAGAQGVMQFMPGTAKEMGIADVRDPVQSIDGAARYLRKLYDAYGSWDAAVAHYNGGGSQAAIVRGGGKPTFPETAAYLERVQKYAAEHAAEQGAKSPETVDAARVQVLNEALARNLPDHPDAHAEVMRATDMLAAGERVNVPDMTAPQVPRPEIKESGDFLSAGLPDGQVGGTIKTDGLHINFAELAPEARGSGQGVAMYSALIDEAHARGLRVYSDSTVEMPAVRVYQALERRGYQVERLPGGELPPSENAPEGAYFGAGAKAPAFEVKPRAGSVQPDAVGVKPNGSTAPTQASAQASAQSAKPQAPDAAGSGRAAAAADTRPGVGPGETAGRLVAEDIPKSLDSQRVQQLAVDQPGLRVRLPGSDETVSVEAALKQAKEEAAYEASEADLVKAAVECALSFGA